MESSGVETYDFANDSKFQAGLARILNGRDAADAQSLVARAKAYYYKNEIEPAQPSERAEEQTRRTFDEVAQLIMAGEEIPGIRHIPDTLSTEGPSESKAPALRKPWVHEG